MIRGMAAGAIHLAITVIIHLLHTASALEVTGVEVTMVMVVMAAIMAAAVTTITVKLKEEDRPR